MSGRGHHKRKKKMDGLNITSMMDMFTIILLFLLKSFSADGSMLTGADNLLLPNSISNKRPTELPIQVAVTEDAILVDNDMVMNTKELADKKYDDFVSEFGNGVLTPLDKVLELKMQELEKLVALEMIQSKDEIIVQVDKNMSLNVMNKIMSICGRQGFSDMKFAVMMRDQ
ncbi:MAG: biopolymer transporter ExbD [Chitinivibrionia bacterium]|nr:biopolymer transporter ExbD [Chitinivibrionia bacterium]